MADALTAGGPLARRKSLFSLSQLRSDRERGLTAEEFFSSQPCALSQSSQLDLSHAASDETIFELVADDCADMPSQDPWQCRRQPPQSRLSFPVLRKYLSILSIDCIAIAIQYALISLEQMPCEARMAARCELSRMPGPAKERFMAVAVAIVGLDRLLRKMQHGKAEMHTAMLSEALDHLIASWQRLLHGEGMEHFETLQTIGTRLNRLPYQNAAQPKERFMYQLIVAAFQSAIEKCHSTRLLQIGKALHVPDIDLAVRSASHQPKSPSKKAVSSQWDCVYEQCTEYFQKALEEKVGKQLKIEKSSSLGIATARKLTTCRTKKLSLKMNSPSPLKKLKGDGLRHKADPLELCSHKAKPSYVATVEIGSHNSVLSSCGTVPAKVRCERQQPSCMPLDLASQLLQLLRKHSTMFRIQTRRKGVHLFTKPLYSSLASSQADDAQLTIHRYPLRPNRGQHSPRFKPWLPNPTKRSEASPYTIADSIMQTVSVTVLHHNGQQVLRQCIEEVSQPAREVQSSAPSLEAHQPAMPPQLQVQFIFHDAPEHLMSSSASLLDKRAPDEMVGQSDCNGAAVHIVGQEEGIENHPDSTLQPLQPWRRITRRRLSY